MMTWARHHRLLAGALALVLLFVLAAFALPSMRGTIEQALLSLAPTATPTVTPTATPLPPTPTATATVTPTPTLVPSPIATSTNTPAPSPTSAPTDRATHSLDVPLILQELPLSCEFAGMRMMLAELLGSAPPEPEVIACMPKNANPYQGFRGDPAGYNLSAEGGIVWENYGAYAPAVAEALNRCFLSQTALEAYAVEDATYEHVATSIKEGYPVMVWVTKRGEPITTEVDTPEGPVRLVFGEHVWVVSACYEDGTFDALDPYPQKSGRQVFHAQTFPNWDMFDRMAVFIRPRDAD